MQLADYLSEKNTLVDVQASTKTGLLSNLCARAAVAVGFDEKTISCEILKREGLGSTGVGGGVAIPMHGFQVLRALLVYSRAFRSRSISRLSMGSPWIPCFCFFCRQRHPANI